MRLSKTSAASESFFAVRKKNFKRELFGQKP
jgi:hypothetical protein